MTDNAVLTYEKLLQCELISAFTGVDHKKVFKKISESKIILDNFLSLPQFNQKSLYNYIYRGYDIAELEAFAKLQVELLDAARESAINSGVSFDSWDFPTYVRYYREIRFPDYISSSSPLGEKLVLLVENQNRFRDADVKTIPSYYSLAANCLSILYDEDRVIEVIDQWILVREPHPIQHFIYCVDNWDNAKFRQHPLHWALNLL